MFIELTFDYPEYLWYFLAIPLLIYTHLYLFRHSKQKAMKFANFESIKRVTGEKLMTKNITILVIRIVLLACLIISVSGTTIWYEGKINKNDFVIAIDNSASMAARDIEPTRFDAAKDAAKGLVNDIKTKSSFGLITFSGTTYIESPLIDNKNAIAKTIDNIEIANTGGTDIPGAIITGTNILLASPKGKTMILITDGSSTVSAYIADSMKNALEYAQKNHVIIYTIGIGSESGPLGYLPEYYNISAMFNENILIEISNATRGQYYSVLKTSDLDQAKKEISEQSEDALIPIHLNRGLMLAILAILFIEWGFINTKFRKIP